MRRLHSRARVQFAAGARLGAVVAAGLLPVLLRLFDQVDGLLVGLQEQGEGVAILGIEVLAHRESRIPSTK